MERATRIERTTINIQVTGEGVSQTAAVELDGIAAYMKFEWDNEKSRRNLAERGFDFAYAARVFADPARLQRVDSSGTTARNGGRPSVRWTAKPFLLLSLSRGEAVRIVSARRAHEHEDRAYRAGTAWS